MHTPSTRLYNNRNLSYLWCHVAPIISNCHLLQAKKSTANLRGLPSLGLCSVRFSMLPAFILQFGSSNSVILFSLQQILWKERALFDFEIPYLLSMECIFNLFLHWCIYINDTILDINMLTKTKAGREGEILKEFKRVVEERRRGS